MYVLHLNVTAPARDPSGHNTLPVVVHMHSTLQELPQAPRTARPHDSVGGQEGEACRGRRTPKAAGAVEQACVPLLLGVLPVGQLPLGWFMTRDPLEHLTAGRLPPFLRLLGGFPASGPCPWGAHGLACVFLQHQLLLPFVLHAPDLVPVGVLFQVALAAAAGAEAEGQVVPFFSPHVLPALFLVPAPGPTDAVELHQDAALPLIEALQVHPVAVGAKFTVAQDPLVVVPIQADGPSNAAHQGSGTEGL